MIAYNKTIFALYIRRFETAPLRGALVQTVTGNLVAVSSAERIEIFNGVKWDNCHFHIFVGLINTTFFMAKSPF